MSKSAWKTLSGEDVDDIVEFVKAEASGGKTVHIGTDSLPKGARTEFVTVLVILNVGKGGRVAYCRELVSRIQSLRERLMKEVWKSVEVGLLVNGVVDGELTIHIDANPVIRHRSSKYVQELVGLVVGQGFRSLLKPDAWASTHAADHIVRCRRTYKPVA